MQPSKSWAPPIIIAGIAAVFVAVMGATITQIGPWYRSLIKPDWTPPDAAFGIIWTTIFTLTAIAAVVAWLRIPHQRGAEVMVGLFALNGALNIGWSLLFFRLQRPDLAMIEVIFLWLSIAALIVVCGRHSRLAGVLLVPYLIWVSVAAALNFAVIQLNPPFG